MIKLFIPLLSVVLMAGPAGAGTKAAKAETTDAKAPQAKAAAAGAEAKAAPKPEAPARRFERPPYAFFEPNGYIGAGVELNLTAQEHTAISALIRSIWKSAIQWEMKAVGGFEMALDSKVTIPRLPEESVIAAIRQCRQGLPETISEKKKTLITALFRRQFEYEFSQEVQVMMCTPPGGAKMISIDGSNFFNPARKGQDLMVQYGESAPKTLGRAYYILDGSRFGFIKLAPALR